MYIYIYISKAIGSTISSILQGFRGISPWKYGWFIAAILSTATGSHVCQHVCFQACTVLLEPESAAENAKFNYGIVQNQTLGILRPSPEILDATGWSLHLSHLSVHCSTWKYHMFNTLWMRSLRLFFDWTDTRRSPKNSSSWMRIPVYPIYVSVFQWFSNTVSHQSNQIYNCRDMNHSSGCSRLQWFTTLWQFNIAMENQKIFIFG